MDRGTVRPYIRFPCPPRRYHIILNTKPCTGGYIVPMNTPTFSITRSVDPTSCAMVPSLMPGVLRTLSFGSFCDVVGRFLPLPASSSAALNCALQDGFRKTVGSYKMAILLQFPLLNNCEEVFVVVCAWFVRWFVRWFVHFFTCDVVQVGHAVDSSVASQLNCLYPSLRSAVKVQDSHPYRKMLSD